MGVGVHETRQHMHAAQVEGALRDRSARIERIDRDDLLVADHDPHVASYFTARRVDHRSGDEGALDGCRGHRRRRRRRRPRQTEHRDDHPAEECSEP